jgi:hypothetical protein
MFTAGTGITCETTADGTVTITNTVSGGISHDGSTANGVLTYKDADEATVESGLTFASNVLTVTGNILPEANNTRDLGSATKQWQNIYTGDLHLTNERGSWTVIEEEDYLTLRNNKNDKVYKLVMEEIE